ncbi:MAG: HEAT repeat domain-containing protein [Planctomycetota bacterium]
MHAIPSLTLIAGAAALLLAPAPLAQCSSEPMPMWDGIPYPGPAGTPASGAPTGPATPGPGGPVMPHPPGPTSGGPAPTPPTGPVTPTPPPGSPLWLPETGGGAVAPDPTHWGHWWLYNRDPFLDFAARFQRRDTVSADGGAPTLGADRKQVLEEIVPALRAVVEKGGHIGLQRESLFALARVQLPSTALPEYAAINLDVGAPEVKEAAALALALHGDPDVLGTLLDLALDTERGRELVNEEQRVSPRLRAMAAYGIGLVGKDSRYERLPLVDALLSVLGDGEVTAETQVACVLALGELPVPFCSEVDEVAHGMFEVGGRHLCGGTLTNYLLATLDDDTLDPWLHAHTSAVLGKLTAGSPETFRSLAAETLLEVADAKSRRPAPVKNGAVIGLGLIADADDEDVDRRVRAGLHDAVAHGDPLSRRLATVALAEVGARDGAGAGEEETAEETAAWLARRLAKGKATMKPWAALSVAVFGHHRAQARASVPVSMAAALRDLHDKTRSDGDAAPYALALGLLGDVHAEDELLERFSRSDDSGYRAHAALSLGLLTTTRAKEALLAAFEEEEPTPDLAVAVAVGLRLLGHREVVPALVERAQEAEDPAARAAWVAGLGALLDGDAVTPLVEVLADEDESFPVRAAAARALGGLADPRTTLWNASYSNDVTYSALTWTLRDPFGEGLGVLDQR